MSRIVISRPDLNQNSPPNLTKWVYKIWVNSIQNPVSNYGSPWYIRENDHTWERHLSGHHRWNNLSSKEDVPKISESYLGLSEILCFYNIVLEPIYCFRTEMSLDFYNQSFQLQVEFLKAYWKRTDGRDAFIHQHSMGLATLPTNSKAFVISS